MPIERRRVLYRGRVQGVGFRYTARRLAAGFSVAGFVRNLPEGQVELVVEGEPAEVDRFLDAIAREMGRRVAGVNVEALSAGSEPLEGFAIRY